MAHNHLGIPKLLDAEDVDTTRPDEKSIIGQLMDCDSRKAEYSRLLTALLEWIRLKITELNCRDFPNALDGIQRLLLAFKQYRTVEKPPKYKERSEIEALYFHINTMQKSLVGEPWAPLEVRSPQGIPEGDDPGVVGPSTERFEDLSAMAAELVREKYHGAEAVSRTEQAVLSRWKELLQLLEKHRVSLARLAHLMALLREADTVASTAHFESEDVGRHLVDVERLLQAHALQELQLGALDESWVTEKQRICRTEVAAKELRGVLALRQKHTALMHELRARDLVAQRHRAKGQRFVRDTNNNKLM
ncbi:unnamed protein product [Leptidea sinapis]|uniref:Uncharacterized protein n=1 Tax=Leptidea sinapis TaxID=189913 RepID=A0A5E4QZM3_9NEOP|nr:unnamed protein product [Leptidea sinapis]